MASSSSNNNHDTSSSSTSIDLANSSNGSSNSGNNNGGNNDVETAQWIERLPESFGIRQAVRLSKYRWCVRESALWGIATGTAMTLHRFRMASRNQFAINVGFSSLFCVYIGSYYFCVRRRDYQEKMIHFMMRLNSFDHAMDMPEQRPIDENHPFVTPTTTATTGAATDNGRRVAAATAIVQNKQYVAKLPGRKEWQKQLPTQELSQVFQLEESSDRKK